MRKYFLMLMVLLFSLSFAKQGSGFDYDHKEKPTIVVDVDVGDQPIVYEETNFNSESAFNVNEQPVPVFALSEYHYIMEENETTILSGQEATYHMYKIEGLLCTLKLPRNDELTYSYYNDFEKPYVNRHS